MPELSDAEFNTSGYIYGQLCAMGFDPVRIHTGMYIDIKGSEGSRTVALRADFDALPIRENTGLPFASTNGCMHACGHDAHTAMCLSAARILSKSRPVNNVRIIFQFAEEGSGGAGRMIEKGAIGGVDMVFALHLSPDIEKGRLATRAGALFAGVVEFDIGITGRSSHVARRELGVDALLASAELVGELSDLAAGYPGVRFQTGKLTAGSARNIVAGSAALECTLRYYDKADRESVTGQIDLCLDRVAGKYGAVCVKNVLAHYPPLINDSGAANAFKSVNPIIDTQPQFTAEDFAMYLERIPGCMTWLGVRDPQHTHPLHSDKFDFDESVMKAGIQALLNLTDIQFQQEKQ